MFPLEEYAVNNSTKERKKTNIHWYRSIFTDDITLFWVFAYFQNTKNTLRI